MDFHFISVCVRARTIDFLWGIFHGHLGVERNDSKFKRYGTLKDGHTHGFINFLGVLAYIYCIFLDIPMFKFKFEIRVHQKQFKLFGGKYLEVWNPRNHTCHTWAMSGINGQASLNLTRTRTWPRVTAETPTRLNEARKHGNGQRRAKTGKGRWTWRGHVLCPVLQRKCLHG
jgi:hypothetical protein